MKPINSNLLGFCFVVWVVLFSPALIAQDTDDFDKVSAQLDKQFNDQEQRIDGIFDAVNKAIDDAYTGVTKRISVKWPDGALPQREKWVTYSDDLSSRAIADYAEGEFIVEAIIDESKPLQEQVDSIVSLSKEIASATSQELDEKDTLLKAINQELASEPAISISKSSSRNDNFAVKDVLPIDIQSSLDSINTSEQLARLTSEFSAEAKGVNEVGSASTNTAPAIPVITVEREKNGNAKLALKMAFVNNYQEKIINSYLNEIKQYATTYDVPVSVILAIIETESSFNPRAVSPVPAFGLMQLVPKTAGVDAHALVFGEKKVVTPSFLFDENNNLRLGTAYFHLLTHRYLRKIEDQEALFYCAVASYNTGVGNLAKTFTGSKSINRAVGKINQLDANEVYQFLIANLPADETRRYLEKVVTRMQKYKQFDA